jgi:GntR family transcriptional repressor for pyruvate dehydrogenase complex
VLRERAADQIITEMRNRIASGALPRGSKLPTERELASLYGVSPPTVREALRALTSTGLIEVRHGSGAYVAANSDGILDGSLAMLLQLESVGLLDVFDLLTVLNLYVAELAITHATTEDIDRMRLAAEATANCRSQDEVTSAVTEFLVAFAASAHQPLLDALCGFLVRMVVRVEASSHGQRSEQFWKRWAGDTSVLRLDVVHALDARDPEKLAAEVARFHAHIRKRIMRLPSLRHARMSDPAIVSFLAATTPGR